MQQVFQASDWNVPIITNHSFFISEHSDLCATQSCWPPWSEWWVFGSCCYRLLWEEGITNNHSRLFHSASCRRTICGNFFLCGNFCYISYWRQNQIRSMCTFLWHSAYSTFKKVSYQCVVKGQLVFIKNWQHYGDQWLCVERGISSQQLNTFL